jgi:pimeloyl-ACP methyl ester carboxylesterase
MHNEKTVLLGISIAILVIFPLTTSLGTSFSTANAQRSSCDDGVVLSPSSSSSHTRPIILIHGYDENSKVWSNWEPLLKHNGIPFCTVSFHKSDDECGTAVDHANELAQIVQKVKSLRGQQVNIVGHSKGGLDARVYLAKSGAQDVANLIMIGTPNGGDPLANKAAAFPPFFDFFNLFCRPALYDLEIGAADTTARVNLNTKYYTISGNWNPSLKCPLLGFEDIGYRELINMGAGHNDGVVPISSVESLSYSTNLGHTHHCHTGLLSNQEFSMTKSVLTPMR